MVCSFNLPTHSHVSTHLCTQFTHDVPLISNHCTNSLKDCVIYILFLQSVHMVSCALTGTSVVFIKFIAVLWMQSFPFMLTCSELNQNCWNVDVDICVGWVRYVNAKFKTVQYLTVACKLSTVTGFEKSTFNTESLLICLESWKIQPYTCKYL